MSGNAPLTRIGQAYLDALAEREFDRIEKLLHPRVRFRGLVPRAVREGTTAEEALSWLRRWFAAAEVFDLLQCSVDQVVDRLHIAYRVRIHDQDGWQEVAQHLSCIVEHQVITDIALLCSGFRPVADQSVMEQTVETPLGSSTQTGFNADLIYDAGDLGCAEGPLGQIAQLARVLRQINCACSLSLTSTMW